MKTKKIQVSVRMTEEENKILSDYAERTGRTQTDILRELIRSLAKRIPIQVDNGDVVDVSFEWAEKLDGNRRVP